MCVSDQFQHAGPQRHRAFLHGLFVKRRLEFVQARHGVAHPAANIDQAGLDLPPVVQDALLAPGNFQQARVLGLTPAPVAPFFSEGAIESGQMGGLGVGQRAVYVKNQGLQHACSAYERVCAYTRLPTVVG